jgi:hypothetical protein
MFVRVKKIGGYEYLYLVENVREGGRHVQRVIKALGRRDEVENSGLLDGLIASAARHSRRSIVLSSFYRGELAEIHRRSIGPDLAFGHLWRETGCQAVLRRHLVGRRFGFDAERAIYLTVLHHREAIRRRQARRRRAPDGLRLRPSCQHMATDARHPRRERPDAGSCLQGHGLARRGDRGRGQRTDASLHRCHRRGVV